MGADLGAGHGPGRAPRQMSGDAADVRQVRAVIRALLGEAPGDLRDVAVLLTDELVTNAVVHGGGRFQLTAEVQGGALHVAVADAAREAPRVLDPGLEQEHGRGMAIVEALASQWGSSQDGRGKVVWFQLDLRP